MNNQITQLVTYILVVILSDILGFSLIPIEKISTSTVETLTSTTPLSSSSVIILTTTSSTLEQFLGSTTITTTLPTKSLEKILK
ncbi:MAG: hypothetical protein C4348_00625 [Patescibacteria group bacterium]